MARRSRHFAGTRYLKRGISDAGRVANEVRGGEVAASPARARGMRPGLRAMRHACCMHIPSRLRVAAA